VRPRNYHPLERLYYSCAAMKNELLLSFFSKFYDDENMSLVSLKKGEV